MSGAIFVEIATDARRRPIRKYGMDIYCDAEDPDHYLILDHRKQSIKEVWVYRT